MFDKAVERDSGLGSRRLWPRELTAVLQLRELTAVLQLRDITTIVIHHKRYLLFVNETDYYKYCH